MLRDRIMAAAALVVFVIFSAIMAFKLGRLDLALVMTAGVVLATADLAMELSPRWWRR